jgi:hypothetical protein
MDDEVMQPVLIRLDARERAALETWMAEQRDGPERLDLSTGDAVRALTRDALVGMGLLDVR